MTYADRRSVGPAARRHRRCHAWFRGLALALLVALAGCDSGRSGSGVIGASIHLSGGGAPGSALLLVQGAGLVDVEGTGGTRSWSSPAPEGQSGLRVLLMDPDPEGAMTFEVRVEELGAPTPSITVLQMADRNNAVLSGSTDIEVRFQR